MNSFMHAWFFVSKIYAEHRAYKHDEQHSRPDVYKINISYKVESNGSLPPGL